MNNALVEDISLFGLLEKSLYYFQHSLIRELEAIDHYLQGVLKEAKRQVEIISENCEASENHYNQTCEYVEQCEASVDDAKHQLAAIEENISDAEDTLNDDYYEEWDIDDYDEDIFDDAEDALDDLKAQRDVLADELRQCENKLSEAKEDRDDAYDEWMSWKSKKSQSEEIVTDIEIKLDSYYKPVYLLTSGGPDSILTSIVADHMVNEAMDKLLKIRKTVEDYCCCSIDDAMKKGNFVMQLDNNYGKTEKKVMEGIANDQKYILENQRGVNLEVRCRKCGLPLRFCICQQF